MLQVDRAQRTVVVSHREIAGYMPAMAMSFRVEQPAQLETLSPGSRIEFQLTVKRSGSSIRHIQVRQFGLDDVAVQAPKRMAIGEAVPDFELTDQHGSAVRLSSFKGRTVAIDFIYTRCPLPDVCPRLSANFALLERRFGERLTLLSLTVDPVYDTPAVLADYARRWHAGSNWHFLTGSPQQIRQAANPFGLIYWPEDGVVTHTSATALIGRDGSLRALLEGSSFTSRQLVDLVASTLEQP